MEEEWCFLWMFLLTSKDGGQTGWKCGFAFEQSRYKLDVWDRQKMGNRCKFVEANTFDGDVEIPSEARKQKHHRRDFSFAEPKWTNQNICFFFRFSLSFSLQLEMRLKPESQAAVMNAPHCSPPSSICWSAERWATSEQKNVGLWQQTKTRFKPWLVFPFKF